MKRILQYSHRRFGPVAAIFFVWLIFSSPYFIDRRIPFPSKYLVTFFPPWNSEYTMPVKNNAMPDVVTQMYPWKKFTVESWRDGSVPLWNPYSFAGTKHAANYQTAVFSPFNLLFLVLPEKDAWSVLVLLQPLLAGLFMLLFLTSLGRSRIAATIGSIAFMFSGFIVVWMAYATLAFAALTLPLTLYAIHSLFRKPSWWNYVLLSVSVALSFLSGHFQISLYVVGLSLAYVIFEAFQKRQIARTASVLLFVLFGILLSGPQLFPSFMAYADSVRSSSVSVSGISWQYLITLIAPDFYGNPVTRNDWFGYYAEWASFIGVAPVLLSTYVLLHVRGGQEKFFLASFFAVLLLAFQSPLQQLIIQGEIPVLSTSAANRIIILSSFSLCVLAGFGLDALVKDWQGKAHRYVRFALVWFVVIVGVWALIAKPGLISADYLTIARRNFILPSLMAVLTLIAGILGFYRRGKLAKFVLIAFLIFTGFDVLRFAQKWMPFEPSEFVYPQTKLLTFLQNEAGYNRVFGNFGNEVSTYFSIPSIEGYDALYQRRYGKFISSASDGKPGTLARSVVLLDKSGRYAETVLQLLGARYLVHKISDGQNVWAYPYWRYPHYQIRYSDESYEVLENTMAYPRAFLASDYRVENNEQSILDTLYSEDFNLRDTLVLEVEPHIRPERGTGEATISTYKPTQVTIEVNTQSPKILMLTDVYDEGWVAYIDGQSTPVYRADYAFRAVGVPVGTHTIQFNYQPESFAWGVRIALATSLFFVVISLRKFI